MKFPAFEPIDLTHPLIKFDSLELDLASIIPDETQARKQFDNYSLNELALSIKKYGVIQPIIVRKIDRNQYQLIAGERRWRAAKIAGLTKVSAIIREYDKPERMAIALIENIQRENLNPIEEAQAIQSLIEECSMTHHQVAASIGRSRAGVSNLLRLLNLQKDVKVMLNVGLLEMGHARALLSLPNEKQLDVAQLIKNKKLSVRETEKLIQKINKSEKSKEKRLPIGLEEMASAWEARLTKTLSSKVNLLVAAKGKGKIVIYFDSLDEADWLINHIAILED